MVTVHYFNSAVLFSSHSAFLGNREDAAVFAVEFKHLYLLHLLKKNGRGQRLKHLWFPVVTEVGMQPGNRALLPVGTPQCHWLHRSPPCFFFFSGMSATIVPAGLSWLWNWKMCPGLRSRAAGASLRMQVCCTCSETSSAKTRFWGCLCSYCKAW